MTIVLHIIAIVGVFFYSKMRENSVHEAPPAHVEEKVAQHSTDAARPRTETAAVKMPG